jgi:hypothetical protein
MELEAQILKVLKAGLKPTHIDGHYGNYYMNSDLADELGIIFIGYRELQNCRLKTGILRLIVSI